MSRLLHRHHPDEAALLVPVATTRPRGVEPRRLACAPGTSATVLRELRADGEPSPAARAALDRLAGPTRGIRTAWLRPVPLATIPTLEDLAAETHDAVTGAHRMLDDLAAYATEIRELLAGVAR